MSKLLTIVGLFLAISSIASAELVCSDSHMANICDSHRKTLYYMRNGCAAGGAGMAPNDAWRCTNDPKAIEQVNSMDIEADYARCLGQAGCENK